VWAQIVSALQELAVLQRREAMQLVKREQRKQA
jgi:hypothetical protein